MDIYTPSHDSDLLLLHWWLRLKQDDELSSTFMSSMSSLSEFLSFFQAPTRLVYDLDPQGLWFACWFQPFLDGAATGMWIRPDKRNSEAKATIDEVYHAAFATCSTLVAITKRTDLEPTLVRLGYVRAGSIDQLFDGQTAYIYSITKAAYDAATESEHDRITDTRSRRPRPGNRGSSQGQRPVAVREASRYRLRPEQ